MNSELPQRMRDIAETVDDWNAPLCANADLHAAAREIERLREENEGFRRQLWLSHGCGVTSLYGDDGEMSCCKCGTDFKRDDLAKILKACALGAATKGV